MEKAVVQTTLVVKVCTPVCICRGIGDHWKLVLPAERKRCQTKCLREASKWERPTWGQHRAASLSRVVWKKMMADLAKFNAKTVAAADLAVGPTTRLVFLHHELMVCNPVGQGRAKL